MVRPLSSERGYAFPPRCGMMEKTAPGSRAETRKEKGGGAVGGFGRGAGRLLRAAIALAAILLLTAAAGAAAAERHTVVLKCGGGGFAGNEPRTKNICIPLAPAAEVRSEDGRAWTLEELRRLPDFRVEGAALRFTVTSVQGLDLKYALACGESRSDAVPVRTGRNLWDATAPVAAWMAAPETPLSVIPLFTQSPWGMRAAPDSFSLQVTFSASAALPDFPMDRVRYHALYENSLSMLEADSLFISKYDDTAESLMTASLPLGVPYYYAGGTEEKFLRRFFPSTTTNYYLDTHMYLCGLDCVGMTHLVYEKSGLKRHPSISDLLHLGVGRSLLRKNSPDSWHMFLRPGDLIAVKHGTFHILMYLGTMRTFGWKEATAGEAAPLLDAPLVIHCGGNPFYYDRYLAYIKEKGYRNTYPPDGGVTVSAIQVSDRDAPHSRDTSWGKHFGWYNITKDQPLLVFRLDDCTDIAWYGPEQ